MWRVICERVFFGVCLVLSLISDSVNLIQPLADFLRSLPDILERNDARPVAINKYTYTLRFDSGSEHLKSEAGSILQEVCELYRDKKFLITIEGHTDSFGIAEQNTSLAARRAQATAKAMVRCGIPDGYIKEVAGFGSARPLFDNRTEKGRAANRRVEITVTR